MAAPCLLEFTARLLVGTGSLCDNLRSRSDQNNSPDHVSVFWVRRFLHARAPPGYFVLLKSGGRFSLNAVMPSRAAPVQAERPKAL